MYRSGRVSDRHLASILIVGVVLALVSFIADIGFGRRVTLDCRVIERHYQAARDDFGTATTYDANGNPGMAVVSTHSPEEFTLILDVEGKVRSRSVWPAQYAAAVPGQTMPIRFVRGAWSGWLW